MTEAEWLGSDDPDHLLKWLRQSKRHRPALRKLGLFACACAGRLGERITDELTASGLALAERMAEGVASEEEVRAFSRASLEGGDAGRYVHVAVWAVRVLERDVRWTSPEGSARSVAGYIAMELGAQETADQAQLLRDVIGNPYRPCALDPLWVKWNGRA